MDKSEELLLANLIYPIVKEILIPKIKNIINKFSLKNIDENTFEEAFNLYLSQRYLKYLIIDTLVFPNKQTLLEKLYQPLTLKGQDTKHGKVEILIDKYPEELIPEYIRVIIEDTAGMGKSTISKKLFISIIEQKAGIPVLIELSQINSKNNILKEIQSQLSPVGKKISQDFILKLLNEGEFIFLFDGFDEISLDDREYVIKDLHRFIEKANYNNFLITSRPEDSLASFGDFQKFKVKPLENEEAYSLLKKYDEYSYKPISNNLIKQLVDNPQDSLQEYLNNPFLVSLLYKSYEYKKDIPVKKSQFYQQVFDALYETHDLSKEGCLKRDKYCNLHIDEFERVLRYVAYFSSIDNKVEYDKNGIIKYIDKAKKLLTDLTFKSSDFLKDLTKTVPVFKKEGNYYKWGHKSLQDYFAAKFIWIDSKESQVKILRKIYDDPKNRRFYNVLDLFYELDPNTFESSILIWIFEDFFAFSNENYNQFEKTNSSVKSRIENHFNKNCTIVVSKKEDFDILLNGGDEEMIRHEYYDKKVKHKYQVTLFHYFETPQVLVLTYIENGQSKNTILELISNKLPEIAENRRHKAKKTKLIKLQEDKVYILNDESSNVLNDDSIFDFVNDLILFDHSIKYDNALKKYNQLKLLAKRKTEDELLDW